MWPTGHIGWSFPRISDFEARATSFLSEGYRRGERLLLITDNPRPNLWPRKLVEGGVLQISSITEVYGDQGVVRPAEQRAAFADVLDEAIDHGYIGIRVAADNTSLVATPERLQAWLEWEAMADEFMAQNPVTGLCAFDCSRTDSETLGEVMHLHQTLVKT